MSPKKSKRSCKKCGILIRDHHHAKAGRFCTGPPWPAPTPSPDPPAAADSPQIPDLETLQQQREDLQSAIQRARLAREVRDLEADLRALQLDITSGKPVNSPPATPEKQLPGATPPVPPPANQTPPPSEQTPADHTPPPPPAQTTTTQTPPPPAPTPPIVPPPAPAPAGTPPPANLQELRQHPQIQAAMQELTSSSLALDDLLSRPTTVPATSTVPASTPSPAAPLRRIDQDPQIYLATNTGTLYRRVPLTTGLVQIDKIKMMSSTKTSSPILPRIDDCECTPSVQHIFRRHYLLQSPMYYIRWIYAILYSLYLLFVLRTPKDRDIVGYIENTTMAMLIHPATDGKSGEYEVTVCHCKLRASRGYKLKNMSLRYKTGKNGVQVLNFTRNGVNVTNRCEIFSTIYFYHIHSMHTKSHLFSNSLVRHIVDNDVNALQESSYTSIPLHYELLHSSLSVLEWGGNMSRYLGYGGVCIRESVVDESRNMSALEGHQAVRRWNSHGKDSFDGKLFRSRLALQSVMERHDIDPKLLDALFNHTIVHSVDHHGISEWSYLRFSLHPWDKNCNTYQAFNTSVFRVLITKPNLNPLAPNTLRSINKPFYQDLYRELKNIDPKMADVVTASVMY